MERLLKKTYRITPAQLAKLQTIARQSETSMSAVVRDAIDQYHPEALTQAVKSRLIGMVSEQVKDATVDTRLTRQRVEKTLGAMRKRRPYHGPNRMKLLKLSVIVRKALAGVLKTGDNFAGVGIVANRV